MDGDTHGWPRRRPCVARVRDLGLHPGDGETLGMDIGEDALMELLSDRAAHLICRWVPACVARGRAAGSEMRTGAARDASDPARTFNVFALCQPAQHGRACRRRGRRQPTHAAAGPGRLDIVFSAFARRELPGALLHVGLGRFRAPGPIDRAASAALPRKLLLSTHVRGRD